MGHFGSSTPEKEDGDHLWVIASTCCQTTEVPRNELERPCRPQSHRFRGCYVLAVECDSWNPDLIFMQLADAYNNPSDSLPTDK